jgi:hypothetical protein
MTNRQTGPDPFREKFPQELTLADWKDITSSQVLEGLATQAGLLPDPSVQQEINALRARATQPRTLAPMRDPKPPTLE